MVVESVIRSRTKKISPKRQRNSALPWWKSVFFLAKSSRFLLTYLPLIQIPHAFQTDVAMTEQPCVLTEPPWLFSVSIRPEKPTVSIAAGSPSVHGYETAQTLVCMLQLNKAKYYIEVVTRLRFFSTVSSRGTHIARIQSRPAGYFICLRV